MIKLSNTWEYALISMMHLAEQPDQVVRIKNIAKTLWISESLLRRIISNLEKSNLIKTIQWRNWGIQISKNPCDISVYEVLEACWEELWIKNCTTGDFCEKTNDCSSLPILNSLQKWFISLLKIHKLKNKEKV